MPSGDNPALSPGPRGGLGPVRQLPCLVTLLAWLWCGVRGYAPGVELEVRHLRALCAIADTGSVRRAARQLGVTQPSLTTQLRRIEHALGGQLFVRERSGSEPTALGRSVLSRARPLVAEMAALVAETRAAALRSGGGGTLRVGGTGSTGSRAVAGWLRRLRARHPDLGTTIRIDVSANRLLREVAQNRLDVVFVHEVTGCPLRLPHGVAVRVLLEREPQFVALPESHPAAARAEVPLGELTGERWMVDPAADGEWDGLLRALGAAGESPRLVCGDYLTAGDLVAAGEVLMPCQPTTVPRAGVVTRPLVGDPLTVRLLLAFRAGERTAEVDAVFEDLRGAYREVAHANATYRDWLALRGAPLAV
ncbi:LysR family transcriptional regulator [Streptomyces sp. OF8]|uniref:LysR family transcriptional regulator n=1 Tax=Streptomyces alkaliterrae TaxID=2213162 RepID=A0A5P0YNB8_9ACTN|nr:LysR family transcriptional regulator [Streptomyces alkaliterrae]MQS01796.1 LysR family transcriptional regulator [Streptomyces alkaliterrae]